MSANYYNDDNNLPKDEESENAETPQEKQTFSINQDSVTYNITTAIIKNRVDIAVKDSSRDDKPIFEDNFSLLELKKIHQIFKVCNRIEEGKYLLDSAIQKKKITLDQSSECYLDMIFHTGLFVQKAPFKIVLPKRKFQCGVSDDKIDDVERKKKEVNDAKEDLKKELFDTKFDLEENIKENEKISLYLNSKKIKEEKLKKENEEFKKKIKDLEIKNEKLKEKIQRRINKNEKLRQKLEDTRNRKNIPRETEKERRSKGQFPFDEGSKNNDENVENNKGKAIFIYDDYNNYNNDYNNNFNTFENNYNDNYDYGKNKEDDYNDNFKNENNYNAFTPEKEQSNSLESEEDVHSELTSSSIELDEFIQTKEEMEMITTKISHINNRKDQIKLKRVFKATDTNDNAKDFHKKCDNLNGSVVVIVSDNNHRFGGYTNLEWKGKGEEKKKDENAFFFILDGDNSIYFKCDKSKTAITCNPDSGPIFSEGIISVPDKFFLKGGTTIEGYKGIEDYELVGGEKNFNILDMGVYEIDFAKK